MRLSRIKALITFVVILICTLAAMPAYAVYVARRPGAIGQVRRTSRRVSRRTTRRVAARKMWVLPARYTTVVRTGTTYYVCGGVYYVQQMEAGKIVYVEVQVN